MPMQGVRPTKHVLLKLAKAITLNVIMGINDDATNVSRLAKIKLNSCGGLAVSFWLATPAYLYTL